MLSKIRGWLVPAPVPSHNVVTDNGQRRAIVVEVVIVFAITLGLSALRSLLSLVEALLRAGALSDQQVALNRPQAEIGTIDLLMQVLGAGQLIAWGALGLYLLWRAGFKLPEIGLPLRIGGRDVGIGVGLTALIGIPGLVLYLISWRLGLSVAVVPSLLDETWWRPVTLTLSAFGNAFAEEVLLVGFLLTRLRQLGLSANSSLLISSLLRGAYHLYQGAAGFFGNIVMGLIFGRVWQRTNRLWPLVLAHTLLDFIAFVGYALLKPLLPWLP
ncbi:MAG: CPBP family intramembrane metalloprotease [Actinophytocola sp.]|nr:CPBP family intramembrane metalloprotease [Actinophytocola sp.]